LGAIALALLFAAVSRSFFTAPGHRRPEGDLLRNAGRGGVYVRSLTVRRHPHQGARSPERAGLAQMPLVAAETRARRLT